MENNWKKYLENNQNIISNLKENFWENVNWKISEEISDLWIEWLKKINQTLWWKFFNSCFHPDEYWIWSYRVSSLVNQSEIADWVWIDWDDVFVDYLDTLSKWWIKLFPNVKMSNKSWWKNLFAMIEEKWNSVENFSAKEKIILWNEIFDEFLEISAFEKNVFNQKILDFFKNILWELWLKEKFSESIKNFSDQEKNLENKIISFLFREKILGDSKNIKKIFQKNLMQRKYLNWFSKSEMYWEFQNAILSIFTENNFWEKKGILEEKNILKNWEINFENFHKNSESKEIFSNSVKNILEDENLWENYFNFLFEELLEKSWWKPVKIMDFQENWERKDLFIYKENWELVFYKWKMKNPEKVENKDWFDLLSWNCENYNLSWNVTIFLMWSAWAFHIWSERWYREVAASAVEKFFISEWKNTEVIQNYVKNVILWLWIFDTFEEWWDNSWKNLAWSVCSLPEDIFKMWIIWWDFAKNQVENFLKNNEKAPEFNEKDFVNSFSKIFENIEEKLWKIEWIKISDWIDKKFFEMRNIFEENKNFENFLNLLFYSYKLDKILK